MIEQTTCHFLICDECPDDGTAEESEHGPEYDVEWLAKQYGWLVEGYDRHICPQCQKKRLHAACEADGGHDMEPHNRFSDGTQAFKCQCGHWEFIPAGREEGVSG